MRKILLIIMLCVFSFLSNGYSQGNTQKPQFGILNKTVVNILGSFHIDNPISFGINTKKYIKLGRYDSLPEETMKKILPGQWRIGEYHAIFINSSLQYFLADCEFDANGKIYDTGYIEVNKTGLVFHSDIDSTEGLTRMGRRHRIYVPEKINFYLEKMERSNYYVLRLYFKRNNNAEEELLMEAVSYLGNDLNSKEFMSQVKKNFVANNSEQPVTMEKIKAVLPGVWYFGDKYIIVIDKWFNFNLEKSGTGGGDNFGSVKIENTSLIFKVQQKYGFKNLEEKNEIASCSFERKEINGIPYIYCKLKFKQPVSMGVAPGEKIEALSLDAKMVDEE